jgi:hypothetical protein
MIIPDMKAIRTKLQALREEKEQQIREDRNRLATFKPGDIVMYNESKRPEFCVIAELVGVHCAKGQDIECPEYVQEEYKCIWESGRIYSAFYTDGDPEKNGPSMVLVSHG